MPLDPDTRKYLESFPGKQVSFDEPMSKHTSFRVGGPADAFARVQDIESLKLLVEFANNKNIPWHVIGDGTNLLVKESGIKGIVIVLKDTFTQMEIGPEKDRTVILKCMAGARMKKLCRFAIQNRLEGMNAALGIPGTVGGGIFMNAGNAQGAVSDVIESVTIMLPDGVIKTIFVDNLNFQYRKLSWDSKYRKQYGKDPVIIRGTFRLCKSSKSVNELEQEASEILNKRKKNQPLEFPSAGCFFKNHFSGEPAGKLIELAGLKGTTVGGAQVSAKHANFIINANHATGSDIIELAEIVRYKVKDMFGKELESEVRILE